MSSLRYNTSMNFKEYIEHETSKGKSKTFIAKSLQMSRKCLYEYLKEDGPKPSKLRAMALETLTGGIITMKDMGW